MRIRKAMLALAVLLVATATPSMALAAGGTTATAGGADIQISGSSSVGSPMQGQPYTYTFQVKNSGPQGDQGVVFTDDLTSGRLNAVQALWNGYIPERCSSTSDGNGGTLATCYLGLERPDFVTVTLNVTAPSTIGSFSNTATATASLTDPQPSNNASTVNVKVASSACPLPAGQPTTSGTITGVWLDSLGFGIPAKLTLAGNDGTNYTVLMNFLGDPTQPATTAINLLCKVVPPKFYVVGVGGTDNVTGPVAMEVLPGDTVATPVIHAMVVQVPFWTDKVT
jgi:uncharacterized repeat protein (TIGR01451 family)